MPGSAVRLGAIRVVVSAVLVMSMASGRPVHTISRFVCMGCERQGEFRRLYGSRRAATTHVGMSPDCRALGLGVLEISVAAGTGVLCDGRWRLRGGGSTRRAPTATGLSRLIPLKLLYNLGYPGLSRLIPH